MMIPPLIRTGPLPEPNEHNAKDGYVVLTRSGWHIIRRSHTDPRIFANVDMATSQFHIHPSDVLCWMPENGS